MERLNIPMTPELLAHFEKSHPLQKLYEEVQTSELQKRV